MALPCILRRAAMSALRCVFVVAMATFADAFNNLNERDKVHNFVTMQNRNGLTGVAATSGSSASDSDNKLLAVPGLTMNDNGDTMSFAYPVNGNQGFATGVIQMKPGSVAVASSSYSTVQDWQQSNQAFHHINSWPMNYAHPQMALYTPQIINPWFYRNLIDDFGTFKPVYTWMHPNYSPFINLWRF